MRFALAVLALTVLAPAAQAADPLVERGRYLVEQAVLCNDCHTEHLPDGSVDRTKLLLGAPLPFANIVPMPWADRAPALVGSQRLDWPDEALTAFLQTGQSHDGTPPRPPMPPYRLNADDARAVVAYLRSLDEPTVAEGR